MAKTKRILKWQRDPEGMRLRILEAAKQEFAAHGLAGARVDRIATKAGANKRMLYYHVGKKDDLYLAVLEGAYEKIRAEERGLDLEHLDPPEAIERLIDFTWNYFIRNPEFLALLNTENLARARHLKRSTKVKSMHSPFVEMIRTVVRRGVESGDFVVPVDPVQLYISIAALCFFYLSNSATLSVIFGRDLLSKEAKDERLAHMVALVLAALTRKVSRCVRQQQGAAPTRAGAHRRLIDYLASLALNEHSERLAPPVAASPIDCLHISNSHTVSRHASAIPPRATFTRAKPAFSYPSHLWVPRGGWLAEGQSGGGR